MENIPNNIKVYVPPNSNNEGNIVEEKSNSTNDDSEKIFDNVQEATITLSVFDAHRLINYLEYLLRFAGPEREERVDLLEKIASQLHDKTYIVYGSAKHRKACPEEFAKKDEAEKQAIEKQVEKYKEESKKLPWWKKLF